MADPPVQLRAQETSTLVMMDDGKVNALDARFLDAFSAAFDQAVARGAPVALTGNAKAFSAGLDLYKVLDLDRAGLAGLMTRLHRAVGSVLRAAVPVVAAVSGAAIAGGAVLAIACDHRVGAPGAVVGATENAVGIPFPPPLVPLLDQRLSATTMTRTVFLARRVQGDEAMATGWLDEIVEDPVARAVAVGNEMLGPNPEAFRRLKKERNAALLAAWPDMDETWNAGGRHADYVEAFFAPGFKERVREAVARTLRK